MTLPERKLAIAPMMDWTDRHCRSFMRIISKHILLYTEMVTSGAIIHGNRQKLLEFSEYEKPLALQVGGSHAEELARCAEFAEEAGFDEINLNVGCPSDRVQSGRFGACLMAEPGLVAECVSSMLAHTRLPVTVKTRLGIDDHDSYEYLCAFIRQVAASGCRTFILHARKAWLQGLSPRENREIPPLRYNTVYAVKKDFPELEIIINGGFTTLEQVKAQYRFVDGVMIGRAAYQNPYLLAHVDRDIFQDNSTVKSRDQILHEFMEYAGQQLQQGEPLKNMTRHILGLYQGQPGARAFRRYISENVHSDNAGIQVVLQAAEKTRQIASEVAG